jgi:glycosyltransferase involved in cell wall biosynthesis
VAQNHGIDKAVAVTCFEVLEHLPNPVEDLKEIFSFQPDILIATSECYHGQGASWPYLSVENGQHVFFYSAEALGMIAQQYGYGVVSSGVTHVFYRLQPQHMTLDQRTIREIGRGSCDYSLRVKAIRRFFSTFSAPYQHVLADHQDIVVRYQAEATPEPPKILRRSIPRRAADPGPSPIVIDGIIFQYDETRGVARVWRELMKQWAKTDFGQRLVILDRAGVVPPTPGLRRILCDPRPDEDGFRSDSVVLQRYCDRLGAKAFVSSYYSAPQTTPSVMLVHDMIPERLPEFFTTSKEVWEEKAAYIQMARKIVCVSENTRSDLLDLQPTLQPDAVSMAHLGICDTFFPRSPAQIAAVRQAHNVDAPYLLQVGGRSAYKNGQLVVNAWCAMPEDERPLLVYVGGEPLQEKLMNVLGDKVRHIRSLDDDGLAALYGGALAMVMPSLYEGFGLPVIEAMACNCPVICSTSASLPEVAGDAAILVKPGDALGLIQAIRAVRDPAIRNEMILRGKKRQAQFSWATLANAMQQALESVADR